jgi:hypothetical protein
VVHHQKDPAGKEIANCSIHSDICELADVTLPESGLYTIIADGHKAIVTDYSLHLTELGNDTTSVTYDQSVDDELERVGDQDEFVFEGQQGDRVNIAVTKDPAGKEIANCSIHSDICELADVTLPESGLYTIIADGHDTIVTDYSLVLNFLR